MIYGLIGVIVAESVALAVLAVIVDRVVSCHLKMIRQQTGIPDDDGNRSRTRVISPYKDKSRGGDGS